jgi:glycosyltransferase involved in cell wall biosynthesis
MNKSSDIRVLVLLPSMRISGGVREVLRLAEDMKEEGLDVEVATLWRSEHELHYPGLKFHRLSDFIASRSRAAFQYPILLARFLIYIKRLKRAKPERRLVLFLTHFSTFPLGWLAPGSDWYCFNQDIEWMFVRAGLFRTLLRRIILWTSRRGCVVTTNAYIDDRYRDENIDSIGIAAIWPTEFWLSDRAEGLRTMDVVMLLRRGHMKRLDLYLDMLARFTETAISFTVITPDPEIHKKVLLLTDNCLLRPSNEEIKKVYENSRIFLLLSETEGFALPPLEGMGSGCVPLCRDSGGPQCYMHGQFAGNLLDLGAKPEVILARVQELLAHPDSLSALSAAAKKNFAAGLATAGAERKECMRKLAQRVIATG